MDRTRANLLSRRQSLLSITALAGATLLRPTSVFGMTPVKNKVRFTVLGDWGTGDGAAGSIAAAISRVHAASPLDFVIAAGDNIYPDGSGRRFGQNFEQPFAGLLKQQMKFYAVLGNHDVQEGRQDQIQYPLFGMGGKSYYAFKQGDGLVEFFMLDSNDFDSTQAAWLEGTLKESTAKWKIAVFHHPIYSSAKRHGSSLELRRALEPLLTRYGVQVGFSGHDHTYERMTLQKGVQYFVTGAGGKVRRGDVDQKSSLRAASFDEDNHFMQLEVEEKQITFHAISKSGVVVDRGVIA